MATLQSIQQSLDANKAEVAKIMSNYPDLTLDRLKEIKRINETKASGHNNSAVQHVNELIQYLEAVTRCDKCRRLGSLKPNPCCFRVFADRLIR